MKLFIWEGVLTDFTHGMAVAYAETLEEALSLFEGHIAEQLGAPIWTIDCATDKKPIACHVYGGM